MIELDKRLRVIDSLIYDYSKRKKDEKNNREKKNYERLIVMLNNQKVRIQHFKSEINQIA